MQKAFYKFKGWGVFFLFFFFGKKPPPDLLPLSSKGVRNKLFLSDGGVGGGLLGPGFKYKYVCMYIYLSVCMHE